MPNADKAQPRTLWVFAYGSLIWNPGFDHLEARIARLDGYRRRFGLWSRHYRGTPERPGLVLGLDWAPGASCMGLAYRVCPSQDRAVRDYLHQRELVSYAYFETLYPVRFGRGTGDAGAPEAGGAEAPEADGAEAPEAGGAEAICYILDRSHPQYAGHLDADEQARIIAAAHGPSGPNAEYLMNTVAQLHVHGIADRDLDALAERVRALQAAGA